MTRSKAWHWMIALSVVAVFLTLPMIASAQGGGQERPLLSGTPRSLDSEHFRVHYTTSGQDAVDVLDADGNGIPDYVDYVARVVEEVWRVQINDFGWAPPPPDGNEGGDSRYDVYVYNLGEDNVSSDVAGYMDNAGGFLGDNLNTTALEHRATYSYLALNNAYDADSLAPRFTVEGYIRAVVAHEFHHAIQAGYDGEEPQSWLWESTSSWMESEVYPQVSDNFLYLDSVFKSPDTCLIGQGGDRTENRLHRYGEWVFLQSLDETHGHDIVRLIWEQAVSLDSYAALEAALATYDDTLDAAVLRFAIRNLLRDYERIDVYPVLRLEGTIREPGEWTPRDGVQGLGTDYVELAFLERGPVRITGEGEMLDVRAVGLAGIEAVEIDLNGGGVVDLGAYQYTYLLITSLRRDGDPSNCRTTSYTVTVTPGGEPSPITAAHDVANFVPLR